MKKTEYMTEEQLCRFFGFKKTTEFGNSVCDTDRIKNLRENHGLPFIKVDKTHRLYYFPDICKWLKERKTVLGVSDQK